MKALNRLTRPFFAAALTSIVLTPGCASQETVEEREPAQTPGAVETRDTAQAQDDIEVRTYMWAVHDYDRPLPPRVDAGPGPSEPAPIPSDAIVLFDGTDPDADLSAWHSAKLPWPVKDGYFECPAENGNWLATNEKFGDIQLHAEWFVPEAESGDQGQKRGNSGIYIMGRYEVQVLESVGSDTYADGMAAAVYGQNPPLVNPGRGIGQWQTYDVIFRAPRFTNDGELERPAEMTVFHNGVLVQDRWVLEGPTKHKKRTSYSAHPPELPIGLQGKGNPVRYRNFWVRPLGERPVSPAEQ
ncbi:MAG: DUF1080 domain-containing protein [Planctomycetota bacterium]